MKPITIKLGYSVLIVALFSTLSFGQIISNSIPNDGKYQKDNKTFIVYDSNSNKTAVYSPHLLLYKTEGSMLNLGELMTGSFAFSYEGKNFVAAPDSFEFKIISHGNNSWKFIKDASRSLTITADDEVVANTQMDRISSRRFSDINAIRSRFEEIMTATVSFANFSKIANGKKVTIQVGKGYKIKLLKHQFPVLQEFLSLAKK